jgi:surface polysaccharide O-acyltransferase-like enzyme
MAWIDNSRIIAIFAVVFLHVAAGAVSGSDLGSQYWWIGNVYNSFARWCVPVFVMISGALLLDPNKAENLPLFYKKRISRILIPITFWSVIFLLWNFLKGIISGKELAATDLVKRLLSGAPHGHLWFLYMIVILYLFTPFLRKVILSSSRREIEILVVSAFFIAALNAASVPLLSNEPELFINNFLSYIPYFFLGYLIKTDERDIPKSALWGCFLASSLLTAIGCYFLAVNSNLNTGMYFYGYLSITVIPMSTCVMYLLKLWEKPLINENITKLLSMLTLGVYLIHPLFLETLGHIGLKPTSFHPVISVPVIAIFVYASSLIGTWILFHIPYLKRTI